MRTYETVFIARPDLTTEDRLPLLAKVENIVAAGKGTVVKRDEWGVKKLAYQIKKQSRGDYVLFLFCADGSVVSELERNLRIDDRVLKYMTILVDEEADVDALRKKIEAAQKAERPSSGSADDDAETSSLAFDQGEGAETEDEDFGDDASFSGDSDASESWE